MGCGKQLSRAIILNRSIFRLVTMPPTDGSMISRHLSSTPRWRPKPEIEWHRRHVGLADKLISRRIVDRANWLGNLTVSLLYVFVLYFFCSLALTLHKTRKVLICILATNHYPGGGYFRVKRIGMTVENPRKLP